MNLEQLIFTWHFPVDTGRKLNVHKTFNLRPVSTGLVFQVIYVLLRYAANSKLSNVCFIEKTIRLLMLF